MRRGIKSVLFLIDADDPENILETILRDGASVKEYSFEIYEDEKNSDGYYKLVKE